MAAFAFIRHLRIPDGDKDSLSSRLASTKEGQRGLLSFTKPSNQQREVRAADWSFFGAVGLGVQAAVAEWSGDAGARHGAEPDPEVPPWQSVVAGKAISQFCREHPVMRIEPSPEELAQLWSKCAALQGVAVSDAIIEQLSFGGGETEWQPRMRALYALQYFQAQGEAGKEVVTAVLSEAGALLRQIVEVVPQFLIASGILKGLHGREEVERMAAERDLRLTGRATFGSRLDNAGVPFIIRGVSAPASAEPEAEQSPGAAMHTKGGPKGKRCSELKVCDSWDCETTVDKEGGGSGEQAEDDEESELFPGSHI